MYNKGTFTRCVNEVFSVALGETSVDLTLVQIRPVRATNVPGLRREPFALVFRSAMRTMLPQKTYQMRNSTIGSMAICFTPIGMDREGVIYEAVFN